jgi:hypothetical protein
LKEENDHPDGFSTRKSLFVRALNRDGKELIMNECGKGFRLGRGGLIEWNRFPKLYAMGLGTDFGNGVDPLAVENHQRDVLNQWMQSRKVDVEEAIRLLELIGTWSGAQPAKNNVNKAIEYREEIERHFDLVMKIAEAIVYYKEEKNTVNLILLQLLRGEELIPGETETRSIPHVGIFLTTSILRFMVPEGAAAFNRTVANLMGVTTSTKNAASYINRCVEGANCLNQLSISRSDVGEDWRTADVDLAVWAYEKYKDCLNFE